VRVIHRAGLVAAHRHVYKAHPRRTVRRHIVHRRVVHHWVRPKARAAYAVYDARGPFEVIRDPRLGAVLAWSDMVNAEAYRHW
jgi:hypothetical protein